MKIWIHVNGRQEGPFQLEELPLDMLKPDTPVWYSGLDDWKLASEAEATAPLVTKTNAFVGGEVQVCATESFVGESVDTEEIKVEKPAEEEAVAENKPAYDPWAAKAPQQESTVQVPPAITPRQESNGQVPPANAARQESRATMPPAAKMPPVYPPRMGAMPPAGPMPPFNAPQQGYYGPMPQQPPMKCPPDYMVWGLLTLLLCGCLLGIVVIINSVKITSRFKRGDYIGAQKLSQTNEWWTIASIVCSIVFYPFVALIQMAML